MAEVIKPEEVRVGCWYYLCCECDLAEIETQDDLEAIRSTMRSRDNAPLPLLPRVFKTRREAIDWLAR